MGQVIYKLRAAFVGIKLIVIYLNTVELNGLKGIHFVLYKVMSVNSLPILTEGKTYNLH